MRDPAVAYAGRADGKAVAYAVFGTGSYDLVVDQTWCPIDLMWELPQLATFMEALGHVARVIVMDQLGTGASDPITDRSASAVEMYADSVLAVIDAVRARRVVLLSEGTGQIGVTFAATYPDRIQSLILVNLRASFPEIRNMTTVQRANLAKALTGVRHLQLHNPRVAHDPELQHWWARSRRLLNSPEQALGQVETATRLDAESVLATVQVPTLVLHRRDNPMFDIEISRAAAAKIPGARFVELPGSESDVFLGDTAPVLAEIERFLNEPETEVAHDRPLATVLFTDIVSSTEQLAAKGDDEWRQLLDSHDQTMDRVVATYRGRVVKHTGDGILATFDGPARAVRCAMAILDAARDYGITLRAGLHTGEIEIRTSDVAGIAVHIASRIEAIAEPNEILVSRTLVDLTAGSELHFEPRGEHELKGVPGIWPIFAAEPAP